jgi:hydrophobe/amphiphile efflux-1 (HAE1) family protein
MNLTELCIRKPVLAWVLMIGVAVFGVVSLQRIGISQFPDVDFPNVNVRVTWEGASAEAVESEVVEEIEDSLSQVEGVKSLSASATRGSASVTVEFDISRDIDAAVQEVQARLGQIARRLPKDVDPPTVSKVNPEDMPIMWVSLAGEVPRRQLVDTARDVRDRLLRVPGVGDVVLGGMVERSVRLWFSNQRLIAQGVTVTEVAAALARQHLELPAGRLEGGGTPGRELAVRVMGEAADLATLRNLVVGGSANRPVRLHEVADIEDGFEDITTFARANGEPAQGIGIRKQRGTNQVAVAVATRAEIERIRASLPPGISIGINYDASTFIERSIADLEHELVISIVLTALVCWLFLGSFSSTLNVVLAIPMSLLGTVVVLDFAGFTLNTFTLLGLALVVGLVVDDAIMVQENITRHAELGAKRKDAASRGTAEIAPAAFAATLAVIAIFLPVVFMSGVIGRFFLQFGVAFSVAVGLSYLEAITLAPARCGQLLHIATERRGWVIRSGDALFGLLTRIYQPVLAFSLRRPVITLAGAALFFVGSLALLTLLPREFIAAEDQGRLMVRLDAAASANLDETMALSRRVEDYLLARPDVERVFASSGFGNANVSSGNMFVTLVPRANRSKSQQQIQGEIRRWAGSLAGARVMVMDPSAQSFTGQRQGSQFEFSVRGQNWEQLVAESGRVVESLRGTAHLTDVDRDYRVGRPEIQVVVDRNAAQDLGVDAQEVGEAVNLLLSGGRIAKFSDDGRRLDIRTRATAADRQRPEDVLGFRVRARSGDLVPLGSVASVREAATVQAILRRDRSRAITITANLADGATREQGQADLDAVLKTLPTGVRAVEQGMGKQMRETFASLGFSFLLGILVAYLILGGQYNSFLHPLTVLTVLPFAISGALAGLWLAGFSLSLFSAIGILLLMGLSKKNSIILVDYANQARERGMDAAEAMAYAGPVRLRPIVMTSLATLVAAIPTSLGLGAGAETRQPMAVAVLGGIIVSTLLSLIVVPSFYVLADRIMQRFFPRRPAV